MTAGGLLGTLLFAARGGAGPRTLARCAGAMAGASLVTAPGPALAIVGLAGVGVAWSYLIGTVLAVLQTAQPELTGRVALFAAVLLSGTTVGGPLTTAVTTLAGPRASFLLGAAAATVVGLALASLSRRSVAVAAVP